MCAQTVGVGVRVDAGVVAKTGQSRDAADAGAGMDADARAGSAKGRARIDANANANANAAAERKRGGSSPASGAITVTNQDAGVGSSVTR